MTSALALFSIFLIYWSGKQVPGNPGKWESLPRNILFGMIIAIIDLAVCVPQSKPIVPTWMISWLIPMACVSAWIVYQFLDYIFARAFGGLLILLAHYLLYASFLLKVPGKPFFSLLCFSMGALGIFFCGKPYLMRDYIRKIAASKRWKYTAMTLSAVYAVTFLGIGILQYLKIK
jgi:hypothetical protein